MFARCCIGGAGGTEKWRRDGRVFSCIPAPSSRSGGKLGERKASKAKAVPLVQRLPRNSLSLKNTVTCKRSTEEVVGGGGLDGVMGGVEAAAHDSRCGSEAASCPPTEARAFYSPFFFVRRDTARGSLAPRE